MNLQSPYSSILSSERLETYRLSPQEPLTDTLARYLWNLALCESLYPAIHLLEVVLRNQIHLALTPHFQEDWLLRTGESAVLREPAQKDIQKVIKRLTSDRKPITTGRVIADLTLGFWVFLFSKPYDMPFWRKNLKVVFPYLSKRECQQPVIQKRLMRIWTLRNRVSHHEPIWNKQTLLSDYRLILVLLGGMTPKAKSLLAPVDRFSSVFESDFRNYKPEIGSNES